jgi:hypothetical protein
MTEADSNVLMHMTIHTRRCSTGRLEFEQSLTLTLAKMRINFFSVNLFGQNVATAHTLEETKPSKCIRLQRKSRSKKIFGRCR